MRYVFALLLLVTVSAETLEQQRAARDERLKSIDRNAAVLNTLTAPLQRDIDDISSRALDRIRQNAEQDAAKRKLQSRVDSISGCAANARRSDCKCFTKQGSIESIVPFNACLAVVDRGLAALNDFKPQLAP